ncbi:MAG: translocation/assembly module TamB domain-containing protein [Brucellaceae bacterium]|nr:translocation/assembly module TamB domain-containing protein [Brucellaceae bacterium]
MRALFLAILAVLALGAVALSQQSPEEEKSFFLRYVEDTISSDNRRISITGIDGVLSSDASIASITVADRKGVWLTISDATINWTRSALLTGRLSIDRLSAASITMTRMPEPDRSLPSPEASPFTLPDLPVSIRIGNLSVAEAVFAEQVFGEAATLSLNGAVELADGSLDAALNVNRLDGPGGTLSLAASFANDSRILAVDLTASEPSDGVLANLLNLEGRPAVDLSVKGEGPLSDFAADIALAANGEGILQGRVAVNESGQSTGFTAGLDGRIAVLAPPELRGFLGDRTSLSLQGSVPAGGGLVLDRLTTQGGALSLEASARVLPDGFLRRLDLAAAIAPVEGERVILPSAGNETSIGSARLTIAYGESAEGEWSGEMTARSIAAPDFTIGGFRLSMGGLVTALDDPSNRAVTFDADGQAEAVRSDDPAIAEALGSFVKLALFGAYRAGEPLVLDRFALMGNALSATARGEVQEGVFDGQLALRSDSLAPFSALAGRPLTGSADIAADGTINALTGGFDLALSGTARGVSTGDARTDRLFEGETTISGRLARDESGFRANAFTLGNDQARLTADGAFSSESADFDLDARIADLAALSDGLAGSLTVTGRASGENGIIGTDLALALPQGELAGRPVSGANLRLEGAFRETGFRGVVAGELVLDGAPTVLRSDLAYGEGDLRIDGLSLTTRGAKLTGDIARNENGFLNGSLNLDATDISRLAALALRQATGAARATIELGHDGESQSARVQADVSDLQLAEPALTAARLNLEAELADLFAVPAIRADLNARSLVLAGIEMQSLEATAEGSGDTTDFVLASRLADGAAARLSGTLEPQDEGFTIGLRQASLLKGGRGLELKAPATVTVEGETIRLDGLRFAAGDGEIAATGTAAQAYALQLTLNRVPLSLANLVRPDLGAAGTIGGVVNIQGPRERPDADFLLRGQGITVGQLARAGVAPLALDLEGRTQGRRIAVDAGITNSQGMDVRMTGTAPQSADGRLDLDVALRAFPLAILNAAAPGSGLGGRLSGSATVTGTAARPSIAFSIDGQGVTASALAASGISPVSLSVRGAYANDIVQLEQASASGADGLSLSASGRLPVSGNGLGVDFNGSLPLSLANRFLVDRGARATGLLRIQGRASGSLSAPVLTASLSAQGAGFVDPQSRVRLNDIDLSADIRDNTLRLGTLNAALATGGSVSVSGTVDLTGNLPADLSINLNDARYADGELVTASLAGSLTVNGPLLRDPLIAGTVTVNRAELTIPENLAAAGDVADVTHRNTPRDVARTIEKALPDKGAPVPTARPSVPRVDVRINAPARIFVRGRGLDTELGGSVRLTGPVTSVSPSGGFEIIRGRLSILGQRITFDSGRVTLIGDLDPYVDFTATTPGTDITVTIRVTGRVSDLSIRFTSQPELPQDEVLARLIFGKGISSLSPLQVARLAAAASELAGGGPSIMDSVREATGLDDLDVVTDEEGNTAARAGRYISDNAYLGVEAGSAGSGKVTIDLDITGDLKARGALGTDESSLGIFYEKDY